MPFIVQTFPESEDTTLFKVLTPLNTKSSFGASEMLLQLMPEDAVMIQLTVAKPEVAEDLEMLIKILFPSIRKFAAEASEPDDASSGRVRIALLRAVSRMVPPLSVRAEVFV